MRRTALLMEYIVLSVALVVIAGLPSWAWLLMTGIFAIIIGLVLRWVECVELFVNLFKRVQKMSNLSLVSLGIFGYIWFINSFYTLLDT